MAKTRIDGADTVDNATHALHRLQSDGWIVKRLNTRFVHASPNGKKSGTALPVKAIVTVELIPRG